MRLKVKTVNIYDMGRNYWFKAKKHGWTWAPATWQGWLILFLYIIILIIDFRTIDLDSHSVSDTLMGFIPDAIFSTIILIIICWKTGEKLQFFASFGKLR